MSFSFKGKSVLVTGAGRGLGKNIVKTLVGREANVIAVSLTNEKLKEIKFEFPQVITVQADLRKWEETRKTLTELIKETEVDYLVNNAGVNVASSFLKISRNDFDQIMEVNLFSLINVSQVVVESWIKKEKGGAIVNISSTAQYFPINKQGLYSASKAAIGMLTRSMAIELGRKGIRVNTVNPTLFASDMSKKALQNFTEKSFYSQVLRDTPLGRLPRLGEIVNGVLFLLSDDASFINGQSLCICGGITAGR